LERKFLKNPNPRLTGAFREEKKTEKVRGKGKRRETA
jgi:hypothetical protein